MNTVLDKRVEFHTHSIHSDGILLPSEILRYAESLDYRAIAITDHIDYSNLEFVIKSILKFNKEQAKSLNVLFIPGVEITHVHPSLIKKIAKDARKLGIKLVVCHGETLSEPVAKGTNLAAVSERGLIDILAHPGYITEEEALLAKQNDIYIELSAKPAHKSANKHIVKVATKVEAKLLINTDAHHPDDLITQEKAFKLALSFGLSKEMALKTIIDNPKELIKRVFSKSDGL